jgi:8-oxo-dGTP pyrophosphatase MutT (NUDIX family)
MAEQFDPAAFRRQVRQALEGYGAYFGIEAERHALLKRQIDAGDNIHSRHTFPGHVTTSGFVLDRTGENVVLIHHRSLNRWLQPGGHYEPPDTLGASALREALEETGLLDLTLDSWHDVTGVPIDIDSHRIPARPHRGEPEHWHHDIRFVMRAGRSSILRPDLSEVHGAGWRSPTELAGIAPQALRNMRRAGLVMG